MGVLFPSSYITSVYHIFKNIKTPMAFGAVIFSNREYAVLRQPKWGPCSEFMALAELLAEKNPTGQLGCASRSSHCNHSTVWNAAQQHILDGITLR